MAKAKEQEVKHTPLPWFYANGYVSHTHATYRAGRTKRYNVCGLSLPGANEMLAFTGAYDSTREAQHIRDGNGELIVRAVNSHADSFDAIAYLILNDCTKGAYWPDELIEWAKSRMRGEQRVGIEIVRAALAAAQE